MGIYRRREDILQLAHGFVGETNKEDLQCSVLRNRDRHGKTEGYQSGYAVKLGTGREGLRSEVLEWSRI